MNDALRLSEMQRLALEEAARFRLLADNVPVLIALYQRDDYRCLYANRRYAETFGHSVESVVGKTFSEIIGAQAAALIQPQVDEVVARGTPVSYERMLQTGGQPQWIEVTLVPHHNREGGLIGAFVLIADISKHRRAEAALRDSESRLEKFLLASVEGIVFHRGGSVTDVNPPLCSLLGYTREELVGRYVLDFISPSERARVESVMLGAQELSYESELVHRNGYTISVELIARSIDFGGERLRMNIVRDIRDRLAAQARIYHLAHHDSLTGLMNRAAFLDRLQESMLSARETKRSVALLFIDLNNFKRVNDSLGHLEGDRVLVTVAERLRACLRTGDQVARFGGDEFVVLLENINSRDDVLVVLQALLNVVEVPVETHGRSLSVTPSIGIALYPEHGETPSALIQHADTAMYGAKQGGGKAYQFFDPSMAASAFADLVIETQLRQALERGEFELYYQPQVEPVAGRLVGAEALLRWRHPERGLLTPDAFLAVAERNPLMIPISQWVLRQASRQALAWRQAGLGSCPVAVNLSHLQFRLEGFAATVQEILTDLAVPADCLQLELTERMLLDDVEAAAATLQALRAQGVTIAVDDFGTGHTALAHLTQLPLDKLKIDQSFVAGLPHERGAVAVTKAIVQMAKGLGLRVGAEGVRRREQWVLLQSWGCDEMQGDLVAPALSATDFLAWARQRA
jgi:diguanylate cyclase (GGDEF)-like protein/PAS domain S-box-containing protein